KPNIERGNDILTNVLYRLLCKKNNNKIANPIVATEPTITTKELKNPPLKIFVCSSPLAIISKFSRPKGSHTLYNIGLTTIKPCILKKQRICTVKINAIIDQYGLPNF